MSGQGFTQTCENITKSPCPKQKKYDSLVLSKSGLWKVVWRWHSIPRVCCYYFCLEPMVKKDIWVRTTCVTVMIIVFGNGILKVTWSQLCSKYLLNDYEPHWQSHFERYPTVSYFTDMDQHACEIFHQDFDKRY